MIFPLFPICPECTDEVWSEGFTAAAINLPCLQTINVVELKIVVNVMDRTRMQKTLNSILLFFMGNINFYTYQNFGDKFLLNRRTVR